MKTKGDYRKEKANKDLVSVKQSFIIRGGVKRYIYIDVKSQLLKTGTYEERELKDVN